MASMTGVVAGTYTVTVTDNNGCIITDSIAITEPDSVLMSSIVVDSNASCNSVSDGGATAMGAGGTSPYSYNWSNGDMSATATGLGAGAHYLTVTDNNGCIALDTVMITEPPLDRRTEVEAHCVNYTWPQNGITYNLSGIYTDTVRDPLGCDSVIFLDLTILPTNGSTDSLTVCDSYTWPVNGLTYTASGSYSTLLTNSFGCDSILALILTVDSSTTSMSSTQACDSYVWPQNGQMYTMTGIYRDTVPNAKGCDSVIVLDLTVDTTTMATFNELSCDTIFQWLGNTFDSAGTYVDTIPNAKGCDSIVTLNLTFGAPTMRNDTITSCDYYVWMGDTLTSTAIYFDTLVNASGCDSLLTLDLTINNTTTGVTDSISSCDQYVWIKGTDTLGTFTVSGMYVDTIMNSLGCDSIVNLDLTILQSTFDTTIVTSCDYYIWLGDSLTSSGIYNKTLVNQAGCDRFATLDLTINNSDLSIDTVESCFLYTWVETGITYTQSGTYDTVYVNAQGCDSTVRLRLKITNINTEVVKVGPTLISSDNRSGVTYQWYDCDADTALTGDTSFSYRASMNGNYKVIVELNGCSDTSNCIPVTSIGLAETNNAEVNFNIMPNPTRGILTVELLGVNPDGDRIFIYDMKGSIVHEEILMNTGQQLDLYHLNEGLYMIRYKDQMKKVVITK